MSTAMDDGSAQLKLFTWLSPAFPIGAFAFSHGLEWAAEAGDLRDAESLRLWLDDLLQHGALHADAVLLSLAYRGTDEIAALNKLALALAPSSERRLETSAQGKAFLIAVADAWPNVTLLHLGERWRSRDIAYPVAFGAAASAHQLPLGPTLQSFTLAAVANLVSAALRLGLVGQSDAQRLIAGASLSALAVARGAVAASRDDLASCAWRSDIAAMRHETQYSRLFRS